MKVSKVVLILLLIGVFAVGMVTGAGLFSTVNKEGSADSRLSNGSTTTKSSTTVKTGIDYQNAVDKAIGATAKEVAENTFQEKVGNKGVSFRSIIVPSAQAQTKPLAECYDLGQRFTAMVNAALDKAINAEFNWLRECHVVNAKLDVTVTIYVTTKGPLKYYATVKIDGYVDHEWNSKEKCSPVDKERYIIDDIYTYGFNSNGTVGKPIKRLPSGLELFCESYTVIEFTKGKLCDCPVPVPATDNTTPKAP